MKIMLSTFLGFVTDRSTGNFLKSEAERRGPVIRDKNTKSD